MPIASSVADCVPFLLIDSLMTNGFSPCLLKGGSLVALQQPSRVLGRRTTGHQAHSQLETAQRSA